MSKYAQYLACIIVLLISYGVSAQDLGKESYNKCIACHGQHGEGNAALKSPALAGQFNWYILSQLKKFSEDLRGAHEKDVHGKTMLAISKTINDNKELEALANYISQLPSVTTKGTVSGNMMNGSRYYQAKCGACHGGKAEGNPSFKAPKLAGQSTEYLSRQMLHFKSGIRGYMPEDKLGRQMAMMSKVVSDEELTDILYYIAEQE